MESQIDDYFDLVIRGSLLFEKGIKYYLENRMDEFEQRLEDLRAIESRADHLRREVESKLYAYTLIPEARGDVLGTL